MLFTALFSLVPSSVFAASNSAYLTPASGSIQTGKTFTVSVDGTVSNHWWGSGPNTGNGTITFPASRLKVLSIDDKTGASFPKSTTTIDNAAGTITINQKTNDWTYLRAHATIHIMTITFQALTSGSASVQFSSMKYSTGTAGTTGGTYTITSPPPPPPPPPSPSPSPTPKPTTKPSTTPKPSVAPKPSPAPSSAPAPSVEETPPPVSDSDGGLKIQNIKITTGRNDGRVSWTVNEPDTSPTFVYGLSKSGQTNKLEAEKREDGSYEVALKDLKPGTLHYFTIKAATANSLQGANHTGTLTTRGYPVQLTVQQNNLLLPGAKVRIDERTFVANKDGIVTTELADGEHTAQITPAGSDEAYPVKFTVAKKSIPASGNPDLQSLMLNVSTIGAASGMDSSLLWPIIGAVIGGIAVIGAIVGFIIFRKRQTDDMQPGAIDTDMLAASYGMPVETLNQNMPAPNLETHGAPGGTFQDQPLQPMSSPMDMGPTQLAPSFDMKQPQPMMDQMATDQQSYGLDMNQPIEQQPLTPSDQPFDPSNLPLPPIDGAPSAIDPSIPAPYTEEEQLASEVAQVESSDELQQPDAIYDEATGELNILHGSERADMSEPAALSDSNQPVDVESENENSDTNDLDIQHNETDSSEELPRTSIEVTH